jgi:Ni/Fe-hydrogenase subunit HybB-like protein
MFMLEKAMVGSRRYWGWLLFLWLLMAVGAGCYLWQLSYGLGLTGLSRNVSWGLYIAQFTFFVGVAASAVMVVLPYYLHDYKVFSKVTTLGEFLAISAVTMCLLFVFVDMGQPARVLNVLRYPSPRSLMFWDMISLSGYLLLNAVIALITLAAERKEVPPPRWIKPVIVLSIPWAISIHTVTAFLYSGLPGRSFWLTAILAPRFLASAFASGPALLILLCLVLRRVSSFEAGYEARQKLAVIVTYAMTVNVFFILVELFTALYSGIPDHVKHFKYLFFGLEGNRALVPWTWASVALAALALALLLIPKTRANEKTLATACIAVFVSLLLDKGVCLIVCGFVPGPLGAIMKYAPTLPEFMIVIGIWASGSFLLTLFYKITVSVREVTSHKAAPRAAWEPTLSKTMATTR